MVMIMMIANKADEFSSCNIWLYSLRNDEPEEKFFGGFFSLFTSDFFPYLNERDGVVTKYWIREHKEDERDDLMWR